MEKESNPGNLIGYEYNDQVVEFDLAGEELMVNATEMGRIFNKKPVDFLKLESTKAFIEELKRAFPAFKGEESAPLNAGNEVLSTENSSKGEDFESKILKTRSGKEHGGTWMCEILTLKFAAWLNPRFEVWIYTTMRDLMSFARDNEDALKLKASVEDKINKVVLKLQNDQNFIEYLLLKEQEKKITYRLKTNNGKALNRYRNFFN